MMEEQNNIVQEPKKKGNGGLVGALLVIIVLLIVIVGVLVVKPDLITNLKGNDSETTEKGNSVDSTTDTKEDTPSVKTFDLANFDGTKCINNSDLNFEGSVEEVGTVMSKENTSPVVTYLSAKLQDSKKEAVITVNWDEMLYNGNSKEYTYNISNFDKKIRKVYVTGWGQSIGSETVFYLMDDGTLEYTPVTYKVAKEAVDNGGTITLKNNGKVSSVKDVVMIATVAAQPKDSPVGGHIAAIAIKADGSFYYLNSILGSESIYKRNE